MKTVIYRVSQKSKPLKAFNNNLAYVKPFQAKFCPVIFNLYPHMCMKFGEFMLKFNELLVCFYRATLC